jgi:hypothetical protein
MNKDLNVQIVKIVILDKKRIIFLLKKLTAVFLVMKIIFLNVFNVMIGMQELNKTFFIVNNARDAIMEINKIFLTV